MHHFITDSGYPTWISAIIIGIILFFIGLSITREKLATARNQLSEARRSNEHLSVVVRAQRRVIEFSNLASRAKSRLDDYFDALRSPDARRRIGLWDGVSDGFLEPLDVAAAQAVTQIVPALENERGLLQGAVRSITGRNSPKERYVFFIHEPTLEEASRFLAEVGEVVTGENEAAVNVALRSLEKVRDDLEETQYSSDRSLRELSAELERLKALAEDSEADSSALRAASELLDEARRLYQEGDRHQVGDVCARGILALNLLQRRHPVHPDVDCNGSCD